MTLQNAACQKVQRKRATFTRQEYMLLFRHGRRLFDKDRDCTEKLNMCCAVL
jgi:hypothetical protein